MSLPIPIPQTSRRSASSMTPSSSYTDSGSGSASSSWAATGVYVPVHKRTPSTASSVTSDFEIPSGHLVYSPSMLLELAKSPLSHVPMSHHVDLAAMFPEVIKGRGNEIKRALDMVAGKYGSRSRRPRRNQQQGVSKEDSDSDTPKVILSAPTPNTKKGNAKRHQRNDSGSDSVLHSRSNMDELSWRDHTRIPRA